MKKVAALLLAGVLILACVPALAGTTWYCPTCGRLNDDNFCPRDGTARPAQANSSAPGNYTSYAYTTGWLNSKLATRTGPGTQYDEPGTFLSAGSTVTVLSKAYDARNEIWWVQVEFSDAGSLYRAYTGAKRFSGLNLSSLPEEGVIGRCSLKQTVTGYYGPGYRYKAIARGVPAGSGYNIYGYAYTEEADFIQIEFYDSGARCYRRAWIPDWCTDDYYMYNGF